jgi:hypothetical protein
MHRVLPSIIFELRDRGQRENPKMAAKEMLITALATKIWTLHMKNAGDDTGPA